MKRTITLLLCAALLLALCPSVFAVNSDYAAYFLTEYQVQAGDTLTSICESRGIKYSEFATIIKNLNGIANPNVLPQGVKYWIPTMTLGEAERYYTVYRHVLVSGDSISALCTTYGANLNNVKDILLLVNGVSSVSNFVVGNNVYLPIPSGSIATPPAAVTSTVTSTAAAPAAAAGSVTVKAASTTTAKAQNGDYVGFYLTPYLCQLGDTLSGICAARGISYNNTYKTMILKLNKLASDTSLIAGLTYWMPSSTVGGAAAYYTVFRHLLVTGDTIYNLCLGYGINMTKYTNLILTLNNASDLTSFKAGTYVLLPLYHEGGTAGETGVIVPATGLDETKAGVGSSTVTTTTSVDAKGNPVTVTTSTSTTVQEQPGLFDAMASGSYYLVPHTVANGESLISICNDMGTSFSKNKDLIAGANSLQSYTVTPGTVLYIPVISPGSSAKYYAVTVKTINWGDTVYGYYASAGADFSVNYKMLTGLNGSINFNNLPVGGKVSVPVLVG